MANDVKEMNTLELYYFAPQGVDVAKRYQAALEPLMVSDGTERWLADLEASTPTFRAAVEAQIREEADVTAALSESANQLSQIGTWRRVVETVARASKDATTRDEMLKVGGYGLGQVRSVKDAKEFLVQVKPLVERRKDVLLKRGLAQEVVDFPGKAQEALERGAGNVGKEKAEAVLAGVETRKWRESMATMLDRVDDAVEILVQQAQFLAGAEPDKTVAALAAEWTAAINEARVQSHARTAQGDVPPSLTDNTPAQPVTGGDPG